VVVASITEPKIALRQIALSRDATTAGWNILWELENLGSAALTIVSLRMPHGQFKSAEHCFAPALELAAGSGTQITILVHCDEPAGLVTENAFVIFHCQWRGEAWRIFIRIRVVVMADGAPETAVELITTQKVGFSGISN